jgi:hypothetical protein
MSGATPAIEADRTTQFILNNWEGAIMHMEFAKRSEPLKVSQQMILERILE